MKQQQVRETDSVSKVPFILLICYIAAVMYFKGKLPPADELITIITGFYASYGYIVVFLSALLEAIFLLGFYFPGSAAILLGAVTAKSGVVFLPFIILLGTFGLTLGYCLNYMLGKYGWYKVLAKFGTQHALHEAEQKLKKHKHKALLLGYIAPNSGALLSTAAGILKLPFKNFLLLTVISQLFWSTVWGIVAYTFGSTFVELFLTYFSAIVAGLIIAWVVWRILRG
jgi:membrane protein DedA with SNARE-associated domain